MNNSYYKMNKMQRRLLFNFLFVLSCLGFVFITPLKARESEVSKDKIAKIERIIQKFTNEKENLTEPLVQTAIFDEVAKKYKLEPKGKPNEKGFSDIAAEIRQIADERFPESSKAIKARALKEAKKKFKLMEKLEYVTVKYSKGERTYVVSGTYYGLGIGGNSVRIGKNIPIAFFDLSDIDRAKFDGYFCNEQRKKYVEKRLRTYNNKKQSFLNGELAERLEQVQKDNEKRGFIFAWKKWRTPKEVTKYLIEQIITKQEKQGINHNNNVNVVDPEDPIKDPEDPIKDPEDPIDPNPLDEKALKLVRLKQKVEKRQLEIAGSQYGVDADQVFQKGDLLVLISLTRDEVNMLTGMTGSDSIAYPKGPIETVTFSYINNVLFKIQVKYRIGPPEIMRDIYQELKDKYGESIEGKVIQKTEKARQDRIRLIKNFCPKDAKGNDTHTVSSGKCSKCGAKEADLNPAPLKSNMVENWKGSIMETQLRTGLLPDASNFSKMELIKLNPKIKEEQDKLVEEEKLRKEEERRRKEEEEFKNSFK